MKPGTESNISEISAVIQIGDDKAAHKYDRWGSALLFSLSAIALSVGLELTSAPEALTMTGAALLLCLTGLVLPPVKTLERLGDRPVVLVLAAALILELSATVPAIRDPASRLAFVTAAVIAGSNLSESRWLGRWQYPLLCLAHLSFNILRLRGTPPATGPLSSAVAALATGANPYVSGGWSDLPLPVVLSVPSYFLQGDPLAALALASTGAGALLAYARPGRVGGISAALLMLLPLTAASIDGAGSEPLVVLLLAATVFCACRTPRVFPFVLGLFLASKGYLILSLPAIVVLGSLSGKMKDGVILPLKALATAVIVTAPFVIWDPEAFQKAIFGMWSTDATAAPTFLSWISQSGGPSLPGWIGVAVAIATVPLVVGRAARTASGFASGVGLIYFALFGFSATAQPSQYALVLAALFIAIGATGLPGKMDEAEG